MNLLRMHGARDTMESYPGGFGAVSGPTLDLYAPSGSNKSILPPIGIEPPPTTGSDRMVTTDTSMSLVVKSVEETIGKIESSAKEMGGYMVDSNLSKPEGAASGTISIRVPSERRGEALERFRGLSVKVVSEHVVGSDVTDQYVDIEARLDVLNRTKTKFEEILASATAVQDLLNVQRELINIQSQIDSLVGQRKYLEGTVALSRITVFLSTDELALPYAPDNAWRPALIFKQAIRSLIETLRGVGNLIIWIAVYSPLWVPIVVVVWWMKRKQIKK